MSDEHEDLIHDAVERLEWDESTEERKYAHGESRETKWRQVSRRAALTGGAAGVVGMMLQACGSSSSSSSTASAASSAELGGEHLRLQHAPALHDGQPRDHQRVLHADPERRGGRVQAARMLVHVDRLGHQQRLRDGQLDQQRGVLEGSGDRHHADLADRVQRPVQAALKAGIPVVAYNADEPQTGRLAYIGQDLFVSGQQMGEHIVELLPNGGEIALFIATPGAANIQPRIDGAKDTLKSHPNIKYDVVATGAAVPAELTVINSWAQAHSSAKGMFAVDAGSTQGVAQTIQKQGLKPKGWVGGGYDLTPITEQLLAAGYIEFTIDQQPYLQGFLPILQLYMYNASGGLSGIAETDTGLKFLDKTTVVPYSSTKSRYEGTGTAPGVQKS